MEYKDITFEMLRTRRQRPCKLDAVVEKWI